MPLNRYNYSNNHLKMVDRMIAGGILAVETAVNCLSNPYTLVQEFYCIPVQGFCRIPVQEFCCTKEDCGYPAVLHIQYTSQYAPPGVRTGKLSRPPHADRFT
jgi:hypothetical protein